MPHNVIAYHHSSTMTQFLPNAVGNFPFTISFSVFSSPLHSLPIHLSPCDKAKEIHSLGPAVIAPRYLPQLTPVKSEEQLFLGQQIRDMAGMGHGALHIY